MNTNLRQHLRVNTRYDERRHKQLMRNIQNKAVGEVKEDDYITKILKYIPGEIVAAYLFATGTIGKYLAATEKLPPGELPNDEKYRLLWNVFVLLVLLTPIYRYLAIRKSDLPEGFDASALLQAFIATLAFIIWVYALGGPFDDPDSPLKWHKTYGVLALMFGTLCLPLIEKIGDFNGLIQQIYQTIRNSFVKNNAANPV